jgi:hypothetical protein
MISLRHVVRVVVAVALTGLVAPRARAQGGVLLQGIVDVEGWSTDTNSTLLTRNRGRAGDVLRAQLWTAVEPWRGIFLFAQGGGEGGTGRPFDERYTEASLDQAGLRMARDPRFVVNVGKLPHPVGVFASRNFSTRNPLIGTPDGYLPVYPVGAMLSGEIGRADYRAAVVSLPLTHRGYQPDPDAAAHPVIGVGFTPATGVRAGVTATVGAYLNRDFTSSQLAGRSWTAYKQRQVASGAEYGVSHFDFRGEFAWSSYDVPTRPAIAGTTGYVEGRYTVTPRVFLAARGEVNHYPFIRSVSQTAWVTRRTDFTDWEAGVGVRATESTLIKASYRGDKWTVTPATAGFLRPGGRAIAIQLSQSFDVMDWLPVGR